MNILLDIGHPAHVHYFKNFIWTMQDKGHKFSIIARNRGETFDLLSKYNFDYIDRGSGSTNTLGRILYLPKADFFLYKIARKFKPDIFLSFGSMYAAQISKLLRKPNIAFDDTDLSKMEYILYAPFTDVICTPDCFKKDLGKKQVRFRGYIELCYLHLNRFKPDSSVLNELGVRKDEKYIVMRFVAFKAIHDIGINGFSPENKILAVESLSKYAKVFISSEGKLPMQLKKYKFNLPAERLHDALYYASIYLGDSQTTSTEAACLGIPSVRCNAFACSPQERANFIDLETKYSLIYNFNAKNQEQAIEKAIELIKRENLKEEWKKRRQKLLEDKIDVTAFMVWFIENYPDSVQVMKANPNYQERFK